MKKELQRIEPSSALKVGFFFGIVLGFILGLLSGYFIVAISKTMSGLISAADAETLSKIGASGVWFFAFFYALFSSLICSLLGALMAVVYNLVAKHFGGLEISVAGDAVVVAPKPEEEDNDEWDSHE